MSKFRSWLITAGVLVAVALIVLGTGYFHRCVELARFESLHQGMTLDEVDATLKPSSKKIRIPGLEGEPKPVLLSMGYTYGESPVFPGYRVMVIFYDERLEQKELQKPTLRDIGEYWWSKLRQR